MPEALTEPPFPPYVEQEVLTLYANVRAERTGTAERSEPHIGQIIIKSVTDCNQRCSSNEPGKGYDCYEYVDDSWRDLPPVMPDEVVAQLGETMGIYAAEHRLKAIEGIFHGGEPLFTKGERAESYYGRILPILKQAVAQAAPDTALRIGMHTNATLLREPILDVLKEHGVAISASVDGSQPAHDLNRVITHNGRRLGTFKLVERGLSFFQQDKYRDMLKGIISVIDLRSDPREAVRTIASFNPGNAEFHLPYATWDNLPPGLAGLAFDKQHKTRVSQPLWESAHSTRGVSYEQWQLMGIVRGTPYADWLLDAYDENNKLEHPLNIRFFDSIKRLSLGGTSKTESIGPLGGSEVIVRTDGSIELPDALRMAYPGAEKMNLRVGENSLQRVEMLMKVAGMLGRKSVAQACSNCDILSICGGGHLVSRYSETHGFDNPSVYCADLKAIIGTIRAETINEPATVLASLMAKRPAASTSKHTKTTNYPTPKPSDYALILHDIEDLA